jgi:elongation factor P
MLSYNELKKGVIFILDGEPYQILEYEFLRMQQRKPVAKTKIKSLISGKVIDRNFHQSENFEEAELERIKIVYIYHNRDEYWFHEQNNPAVRFSLREDIIGESGKFLKNKSEVTAIKFQNNIINIDLPIKMEFQVIEAPPAIRGNTAQGGTKSVTLETGAVVNVPLFVDQGDVVRINTQTGDYVDRVEKAK